MKLEDLDTNPPGTRSGPHLVIFMPFLRMRHGYRIGGVDFLPLRDADGNIPAVLEAAIAALEKILSGYVDRHGQPFTNCVVATIDGRWDLSKDEFPMVRWAASLLFLASWAANEYFRKFGGSYVDATNFRVVGQSYSGDLPHHMAVAARRRDGESLDGGYKHGELKFTLPVQCSIRNPAEIDEPFLKALDVANAAGSEVIDRLRTALPFVELANTDDDFMALHAEGILMGSAFEQVLRGDASSYKLGERFADLFESFGAVTVAEVQKVRPDIEIDTTTPERAAAQPKWWVHRKWMEELYDVRSKVVHKGTPSTRKWGWTLFEHLLMAAHVFPVAVKLLLEREGHYTPTDDDRVRCFAIDKVLASPSWFDDDDKGTDLEHSASRIVSKIRLDQMFERAAAKFYERSKESEETDKTDKV